MGNELNCKVRYGKQESEGKALLETSEILFRGDFRLKIPFATIKSAKAVDGELRLQTKEGLAVFGLGACNRRGPAVSCRTRGFRDRFAPGSRLRRSTANTSAYCWTCSAAFRGC